MSQTIIPLRSEVRADHPDPFLPHPAEEMNLGEWLANFWEGRYLILAFGVLFLGLGVFYVWRATPVYQVEALLQVQAKKERSTDPSFNKMGGMFAESADATAEIEILKSNLVLGRAIEALNLDLVARPHYLPVVGAALMRDNPAAPAIAIQNFTVPEALRGIRFRLTALPGGAYQLASLNGEALGTGRPGETLKASYADIPMQLNVRSLTGKPGQWFELSRKPMPVAIADLRKDFSVAERGKDTNVIGLAYKSQNPIQAAAVLNQIVDQYVRHKVEKKGGEASQTLAILQEKMPLLKARLDEAESRLNAFRSHSGSVDLTKEAEGVVVQSANLNGAISALKQKREDLLRTYQPTADVVTTVNEQIRKLQGEVSQVDTRARALPGTQQTVVRLSRDVAVNQELYTALLNNIQELQFAKAGDVGSYDLVDRASPATDPIGPKPAMQISMFAFLGLLVGTGLAKLKRMLWSGVKDHRLIESKLGLPVVVTIPHSDGQDRHAKAMSKHQEGIHLLAVGEPDELATESLRSLRTMLNFAMKDAADNVVVITGPAPGIGKSFVAANFAALMAQSGARVLLVDGDLRKGNLHHYFGLKSRRNGFGDVLTKRATLGAVIQKTAIPDLDLLTTGLLPPNPSELLMSEQFQKFLTAARGAYQFVVLDAPPVLAVTDATIMGTKAGTVLLVAKFGRHPIDEIRACQKVLDTAGVRILGCVFNDVQTTALATTGSGYQYAYHYSYKA